MVNQVQSTFTSLEKLLLVERSPKQIVGYRNMEPLTWSYWQTRVNIWRHVLAERVENRVALFHADAIEFSAILFALSAENKVAVIPANAQPVTVEILEPKVECFIGDFNQSNLNGKPLLLPPKHCSEDTKEIQGQELELESLVLEVFTSGSSGEPVAIPKKLFQLSNEINNLQLLWGSFIENATVFATVSHHHIYGLLFRVLWPLAAGRPFNSGISEYLEDLVNIPIPCEDIVTISSPTHLSRLPNLVDWGSFKTQCKAIFSSGAPLPRQASLDTQALLHLAPIEVYGSSETGGIAWRQQSPEEDVLWRVVPGIKISINEESDSLQIQSPYLADKQWYVTSDQVQIESDESFRLLGRVDRIVKVEGKRLSLSEMERRLQLHDFVEHARVIVVPRKRMTVCAVVVLNDKGKTALAEKGKREINMNLSQFLNQQFERPVLPRWWRYPDTLPKDTQGKVLHSQLVSLFE